MQWRSLLLLVLGIYLPLQIFAILAVQIWQSQGGIFGDISLLNAVHGAAQKRLDLWATHVTDLGVIWGVAPVATVVGLIFLRDRRWRSLIYLIVALLGSPFINHTAKFLFHRVRPHLWEPALPLSSFAFPSGHAMSSMTLVSALLILTWGSRWFWPTFLVGSIYVVTIGWTRLYLGAHYPSDILAGWMISIAWTIGLSLLVKPHLTEVKARQENLCKP
jgi:undecaprenyl-diphosphatase